VLDFTELTLIAAVSVQARVRDLRQDLDTRRKPGARRMNAKRWVLAAGVTLVGVATAAGVVGGASATTAPPDVGATAVTTTADDAPLTGEPRDRAVAAAIAHVGGGEVTDTEMGDGGAAYGVEVRKPDGTQVEVNLDPGYAVTSTEADDEGPGDDEPDEDADDVNDDDGPNDPDDDPGEPPSDPND
jgi:uncharacterized membrane protein YkoI